MFIEQEFEQEWELFLKDQKKNAKGTRLERLNKELIGEKKMFQEVLWPVFRTFEGFTLEYAIKNTNGVTIYIDAFYEPLKFAFESDGFIPHAENISRDRFSFERMRIRTFALYGFKYIPFSWDELDKKSHLCRRSVFEILGKYRGSNDKAISELSVYEREIIRYMSGLNRPFGIQDVCYCLNLRPDASRKILRKMMEKNLITPAGQGRQIIRSYALNDKAMSYIL